ncbi:AMP-binding protein [Plantibacter sp. Mn2098]|uniref:AMP-binding protein n=1 Tax=Plantibacter sp. Mn2098 TaxID=3395266 RepID=UPI003BE82757
MTRFEDASGGERIALRQGGRVWTESAFRALVADAGVGAGVGTDDGAGAGSAASAPASGAAQITLITDADPVAAVVRSLAVRDAGGVPVIGDDRWDDAYRATVTASVEALGSQPGAAWATLSSGSTGAPRVIVRSEASWADSFDAVGGLVDLSADDTVYVPASLVSSMSVFSIVHARAVGATVLLPSGRGVSGGDLAHATVLHGTPQALRSLVELAEAGVPHRVRAALIGGAHLDAPLRSRAEALGISVVAYYGAAELSFVAVDRSGDGLVAFPGVELRVLDRVLHVRSPYFAFGYPGAVHGAFERDDDGWGTVGDLVDGDGITTPLRLLGRRDGAILTAAATVIPEDVEAALRGIDGIDEVVVIGIPQARIGALVGAVLEIPADRAVPRLEQLVSDAKLRLTSSHLPRRWYWTHELPRTGSGKVARAEISRAVLDGEVARLE